MVEQIVRVFGITCLVLLTLSTKPSGQPAPKPVAQDSTFPSIDELMHQAMARAKSQDETSAELDFESLILTTVDTIDGDEQVTETETSLHKRYSLEGSLYEEMVERDGEPLDKDQIREEQKRKEKFRTQAAEAAEMDQAVETDDERQFRFDEELMGRYRAEIIGEESMRGEPCWIIYFQPKEGKLPENTRMDKALNRSTGRIFVSQQDYGVMRIEFDLQKPIRYLWGMMASLRRASGRLDFKRVGANIWLPEKFDMRIDIRIFFRTIRRQIVREWVERNRIDRKIAGIHKKASAD